MLQEPKVSHKTTTRIVIAILILFVVFILDRMFSVRYSGEVPITSERGKYYDEVAAFFITHNVFISSKIGKVMSVYHYGKGGSSGEISYNVFSVHGEEKDAICNVTLMKDTENMWYVSQADISIEGKVLKVPVKRSEGQKHKLFKLR